MFHHATFSSRFYFAALVGLFVFSMTGFLASSIQAAENRFSLGEKLEEDKSAAPIKPDDEQFHFSQDEWNQMRHLIEGDIQPVEVSSQTILTSSGTVAAAPKPPPGLLSVELPYESSLSITGRKVIKLDIENTHISADQASQTGAKQDTQSFNMQQELQARIQGTVARKTTINVNFDDTKENVKDFSVVYKGDPDEVVQEAAFGDIVLSLPSTEFVNYNKQLFGIRAALKYKNAGLMLIGSRTKGTTETKRFTGATTRQQKNINDTAYLRYKFYDMTFSTAFAMSGSGGLFSGHSILPLNGTIPELVYIEDTTGLNTLATNYAIATPTAPTTTTLFMRMRLMSPGVDYSIDRIRGIITFVNPISPDVRVAVDFTLADNTRVSSLVAGHTAVLIKDHNPETPGVSQEIKRFYSLGDKNIVRDNGLGNFALRVLDKNVQTDIGNTLSPIQKYPDTITMQFETGIFELTNRLPFDDVYLPTVNSADPLHAVFSVEYQSIIRTFTLRPNIVLQSEVVTVNGRKMSRDLDYFIDYDIGIITFFNEDLIRESTVIEITYEFAPFGGVLGETLVGARATYDIWQNKKSAMGNVDKWSAGSTVLYDFAAKPTGPPDIRSTPQSLLVIEGDSQAKGIQFGTFRLKTNLSAEAALSEQNPDLFGRAIIDSMEGIQQEDDSTLLKDFWQPASNPENVGANLVSDFRGRDNPASHLRWSDGDVLTTDPSDGNATQKALEIDYSLNTKTTSIPEQVSLVNVISLTGRDFSKKTTLDVEIEGACTNVVGTCNNGTNVELQIDYGSFKEDADGNNQLDTEDQANPVRDGILNLGEDIGYVFHGPGDDLILGTPDDTTASVGAGNLKLDSEDLDKDGVLSPSDQPVTNAPLFLLSQSQGEVDSTGTFHADLNFSGRRLFQIPLNVNALSADEQSRFTAVKQVRITIRNGVQTAARNGSIKITRLGMVGNTYEPATIMGSVNSTMTVSAVNNKDNAGEGYISMVGNPAYNDLYKDAVPSSDAKEQALALTYQLDGGSSGTTRNLFSVARDFSTHDVFRYFLSKPSGCSFPNCGGKVFLQVGSETDYQQATVDIATLQAPPNWKLVTIKQIDANTDGTPDTWVSDDPSVVITQVGAAPNLTQVAQIKIGVINDMVDNQGHPVNMTQSAQVWINEIHEINAHERTGHAKKYSFDSSYPGWMDFGGSYRSVDRNWMTPTTAITNQDSEQTNMFANFNRISFFPMTFKNSRDISVTPSAFRSNTNGLVSFFDEGRVDHISNIASAKLLLPVLPTVDMSYSNDSTVNSITQRREYDDSLSLGSTYAPKTKFNLLPSKRFTFRPIPTSITYLYTTQETKLRFPSAQTLVNYNISTAPYSSTDLTQFSIQNEARMAFKPWDGFSFNPSYKLKTDTEKRDFRQDEIDAIGFAPTADRTPRDQTQTANATGSLRIFKWLEPRYNYSVTGTETNGLPTQSNTTAYMLKTITRNSQGEVSTALQLNQVLPRLRLLNSMNLNGSYKLENGDSYENMPQDFQWRNQLRVGKSLIPDSTVDASSGTDTVARRLNATDRRTYRTNLSWQPLSAYKIINSQLKPFGTMSITSNYLLSREDDEDTGTFKHVDSITFPDLILTMNDIEKIFNVHKVLDSSRLVFKTNRRLTVTKDVTRDEADTWGVDYQFRFFKKVDVATSFNNSTSREDNLVINQLASKSDTTNYSIQTRIPWRVWAFTPRYEHTKTNAFDSLQQTNDLSDDIYSLQIYGDIAKPLGIRLGRKEIGLANRMILNANIKWDKKRSAINPSTNYLDEYSGSVSGDYTISQNFRMAIGATYLQDIHNPEFKQLDTTTFGINTTLTIQF